MGGKILVVMLLLLVGCENVNIPDPVVGACYLVKIPYGGADQDIAVQVQEEKGGVYLVKQLWVPGLNAISLPFRFMWSRRQFQGLSPIECPKLLDSIS